jgi:hypothetical protein
VRFPNLTTLGILLCAVFIIASAVNDGQFKFFWGLPFWGLAILLVFKKKENRNQGIILIPIAFFFIWAITTRETNSILYPIIGERAVVKKAFQVVYLKDNFDGSPVPTFFGKLYQEWERESLEEMEKLGESNMNSPDFTRSIIMKEVIPRGTDLIICRVTARGAGGSDGDYYLHFCFDERSFKYSTADGEGEESEEIFTFLTYSPSLLLKKPANPLWPPFEYLSNLMYWQLFPFYLQSRLNRLISSPNSAHRRDHSS